MAKRRAEYPSLPPEQREWLTQTGVREYLWRMYGISVPPCTVTNWKLYGVKQADGTVIKLQATIRLGRAMFRREDVEKFAEQHNHCGRGHNLWKKRVERMRGTDHLGRSGDEDHPVQ